MASFPSCTRRALVLLILALVWPSSAAAPPALPSIDTPARSGVLSAGDTAVVIGIEDYYQFPDVPFATADARAFRDLAIYTLGISPDRVWTLTGAVTRKQIEEAVAQASAKTNSSGKLWIYFAGHGLASPRTAERILLAGDASMDPRNIDENAVKISSLRREGARNGARVVIVTDACYTGGTRTGEALVPGGKRYAVPVYDIESSSRVAEWVAADAGQTAGPLEAAGHGAFTYFAVGALRGWADGELTGDRDGKVTLTEAQLYVERQLRLSEHRDQTPVLSASSGDLVVSRGTLERGPTDETVRAATVPGGAVSAARPSANKRVLVSEPAEVVADVEPADPSSSWAARYSSSPITAEASSTRRSTRRKTFGGNVMAGVPISSKMGYRFADGTLFGVRCLAGLISDGSNAFIVGPSVFVETPVAEKWNFAAGLGGGLAGSDAGAYATAGMQYAPASGFRVDLGLIGVLGSSAAGVGPDIALGWGW